MFANARFNGDISHWNVSSVGSMVAMFSGADFNGDISSWDIKKNASLDSMFSESLFSSDLSRWNPAKTNTMFDMFKDSVLEWDGRLPKWFRESEWMLDKSEDVDESSEGDIEDLPF